MGAGLTKVFGLRVTWSLVWFSILTHAASMAVHGNTGRSGLREDQSGMD